MWKSNYLKCFLEILNLNFRQSRQCHRHTFSIFDQFCHSQKFKHSLQKLSQDLPWCKFLSFHQHRITFFTDSIDIIDHDPALFPDKVICFQSYAIVFLLRSPAQNTGSLILISTRFHRKRTCLVSFSVIITYLRILFAKINSHDQITNFVHLFLPVSGQSVPALLSRSQTSSSHIVPGEDTSSPVKTLLSFYPVCVQRASD